MKNIPLDFKHIRFSFHYGLRLRPMRDWFVILAATAVLLVVSAGWNFWYYESILAEASAPPQVPQAMPVFSQSSVDQIHAIFTDRSAEETKYQDRTYSFIDPSR